jgi:hypothetical protein
MLTALQIWFGHSVPYRRVAGRGDCATRRCTIARRQNIALLETLGDSALRRFYAREAIKPVRRLRRGMTWRKNHVWS